MSTFMLMEPWLCAAAPGFCSPWMLFLSFGLVVLSQQLIDSIGHSEKKVGKFVYQARNRWHSLPGVILLGLLIGLVPAYLAGSLLVLSVFVAPLLIHWLEDLVTEGGVYVLGSRRRIRLPWRVRYDNPWANRAATLTLFVPMLALSKPFMNIATELLFLVAVIYNLAVLIAT